MTYRELKDYINSLPEDDLSQDVILDYHIQNPKYDPGSTMAFINLETIHQGDAKTTRIGLVVRIY